MKNLTGFRSRNRFYFSIGSEFCEAFTADSDVEDLEPDNFNTVEAMKGLVDSFQEEN